MTRSDSRQRILLTSSRAPVTLDLIRAFVGAGHEVYASDTFAPTLGSHSRGLKRHILTPSPRHDPEGFGAALLEIVTNYRIDHLIPTCEEVFHVARHREKLTRVTTVHCPTLPVLDRFHNKFTFQRHAQACGLHVPRTDLLRSPTDLTSALRMYPRYLLKPAYSRFASHIITNCGSCAGRIPVDQCKPTPEHPWLIQEFIDGDSECSYSVVHEGRITAHCAYRTPHRVNAGAGTSFQSVEGGPTREIAGKLLAGMDYTGQFSLDFLRTSAGDRYLLECNPRATSGVHLMGQEHLVRAILDPHSAPWMEPAGRYQQLLLVVLGQHPLGILRQPPYQFNDVILHLRDPLPTLMQVAQMVHFYGKSREKKISLIEATTEDIEWNGPE